MQRPKKLHWRLILAGVIFFCAGRVFAQTYSIKDLGTLPGGAISAAYGINPSGQIVGQSGAAHGGFHAFSYANGALTDLGTLQGEYSLAAGINQGGIVAGRRAPIAHKAGRRGAGPSRSNQGSPTDEREVARVANNDLARAIDA